MLRSKSIDVTALAGAEGLETFVSGIEGKSVTVTEIRFEPVAAVRCRGYLDQDRIVDVAGDCYSVASPPIPVNLPLPTGREFKAGFQNDTGGNITQQVTVFWEEQA